MLFYAYFFGVKFSSKPKKILTTFLLCLFFFCFFNELILTNEWYIRFMMYSYFMQLSFTDIL